MCSSCCLFFRLRPPLPCVGALCMRVVCVRQPAIKGLQSGGLVILSITDVTPIPHNGCRPKKARRL
eukprot:m.74755 g.74755  ORF g.74755 m.74755 type:complete len:66 (+) comp17125_c0_seq4:109-306(+)